MENFKKALVIKNTGSHYNLTMLPEWKPFQAVLRGKMRLKGSKLTNPIAVGDYVNGYFVSDGDAVIESVEPRRNYLIRRSTNLSKEAHIIASNIDMAYLVLSVGEPSTPLQFIDRFLVTCEAYSVPVTILLNKADILSMKFSGVTSDENPFLADVATIERIYGGAGYNVKRVSVRLGLGMEELSRELVGKVSLFAGVSGVGKSSLANALDSSLNLKTAPISSAHFTGRHTTTFYEMHKLSKGGFFIDSPGIKGFGLLDMEKECLYHYFPEMFKEAENCKFNPCLHINEPHCAVKRAVEEGRIAAERYESYVKILSGEDEKYR